MLRSCVETAKRVATRIAVLSTRGGSIIYNNNAWEFDGIEVLKLCEFISVLVGRQPTGPIFVKRRCWMCISAANRPIG